MRGAAPEKRGRAAVPVISCSSPPGSWPGATIVAACGEIDASHAEQFCRQVHWRAPVGDRALIIDLGAVSFLSGQGLRALLASGQRCDAATLPWAAIASPAVARTLHLTDLPENAVHQARSVSAALSALLTAHKQ